MGILKSLYRVLFPASLDSIFSEEAKEKTAITIAARYSRGNTRVQKERVTTDRMFANEMERMAMRVARTR